MVVGIQEPKGINLSSSQLLSTSEFYQSQRYTAFYDEDHQRGSRGTFEML